LQDALVTGLQGDAWQALKLSEREQALLLYADRLTLQPASVSADDIARLRAVGLDDRAIHDACAIVSYFAFVNRIADGLGVELEDAPGLEPRSSGQRAAPAD
jgi:uncharacterized peroxidase-related enzyme